MKLRNKMILAVGLVLTACLEPAFSHSGVHSHGPASSLVEVVIVLVCGAFAVSAFMLVAYKPANGS